MSSSESTAYVGVAMATDYLGSGPSGLKKYMLMYDTIHLLHLEAAIRELRGGAHLRPHRADDFEWLLDEGVLGHGTFPTNEELGVSDIGTSIERARALMKDWPGGEIAQLESNMARLYESNGLLCRASAAARRSRGHLRTFAIESSEIWTAPPVAGSRREQVMQIVIHNFPELDEEMSLQDVLQLRADSDFRQHQQAIRIWVRKAAEGKADMPDIHDELRHQLSDYERYMKAINVKYTLSSVGSVAKLGAGVALDLASLRWKDAFETVFSLFSVPAALTEAEMKAPGREVSFLSFLSRHVARACQKIRV